MNGSQWYALQTKTHKESAVYGRLLAQGITVYLPCLGHGRRPYFPGYLFVHADLHETGLGRFNWLPGSKGLVQFGDWPAVVPAAVVEAVKQSLAVYEGQVARGMERGTAVAIVSGPLAGYEGVFERYSSGKERVIVLLSLLQKRVAVGAGVVTAVAPG